MQVNHGKNNIERLAAGHKNYAPNRIFDVEKHGQNIKKMQKEK